MAKARAIVKRRKAVRNIKKITKTMQMIATAKFQKSLKRAVGTKAYSRKVRELVAEVARSIGDISHPLLRRPSATDGGTIALVVITSNRGLAGAYNGSVLRMASHFLRDQEANAARSTFTSPAKRASAISISRSARSPSGSTSATRRSSRTSKKSPRSVHREIHRRPIRRGSRRLHELHQRRRTEAGSHDAAAAGGR
jgi:ATP synthase F1 gamma subunit